MSDTPPANVRVIGVIPEGCRARRAPHEDLMFVLDTNTLSYFFRGEGRIAERLASVRPSDVAIPTVVLFEIEAGIARSAARIRAELEVAGTPIGPYDVLIAGTAVANGATLVTRNEREFGRVSGLAVEDWY